ncbi:MAG: type VI secretion system tip protein VgrG [Candidatus Cloacimonetes bacterium]|nr:type VI secretion system tip protein VgrG [Candidatus Cloacimonadota bacterium]
MENKVKYGLLIDGNESDLSVLKFEAQESISCPYIYKILFNSDIDIQDLREVVKKQAQFTLNLGVNFERKIIGYINKISQEDQRDNRSIYRLELVPQVYFAKKQVCNQVFLDKSVSDILPELLEQMGLTSKEFNIDFKSSNDYKQHKFISQYNESSLDFMQRWMARLGIYYFFDVEKDNQSLMIIDSNTVHRSLLYFDTLGFRSGRGMTTFDERIIWNVHVDYNQIPRSILLRDYNFHKSSMGLEHKKIIDINGQGDIYYYGEDFETEKEAEFLANIRADSEICHSIVLKGSSNNPSIAPGYTFTLEDHYRDDMNQEYLIIKTKSSGINADEKMTNNAQGESSNSMNYLVEFEAIPAFMQFRSHYAGTKELVSGIISGRIDSAGDGQYADIDDEGRYKVILPYDRSGRRDGRASHWIRKSESYLGDDYGIHFPLHKNSEVLVSFEDGDPDRPVIIGAVHNSENNNPVTGENYTQSIIKTAGGNKIIIDDNEDKELISIYGKKDEKIEIENDRNVKIKNDDAEEIGNDQTLKVINDQQLNVGNDRNIEIGNNLTETINNDNSVEVKGNFNQKIGKDTRLEIKGKLDEIIEKDNNLKNNSNYNIDTAKKLIITAGDKIQIKCGSSEIVMDKSGKIQIKGVNVTVKASGTLTLKGAKIGEN